jgi:hypothetical protein
MSVIGTHLLAVVVVMMIALGPVGAAGWLLMRRKRLARQRRKSPLTAELLRSPGQALRDELEDQRFENTFDLMMLLWVPLVPLAMLYAQALVSGVPTPPSVLLLVLTGAALFVAHRIRNAYRRSERMDRLRLGLDAELAVGQELDQLMLQQARVFHDIPGEKFNIDHAVVAPQGVFAVETKGYSKANDDRGKASATVVFDGKTLAFPGGSTGQPVAQAQRNARWLADWLTRATGEPVAVTPVGALPGWFVERKGRGDVQVFSGKELRPGGDQSWACDVSVQNGLLSGKVCFLVDESGLVVC